MSLHEMTSKGYRRAAKDYVYGRPGYPPETVSWLQEVLGSGPGRSVLEVGAGTGKFIPVLEECGGDILALEPVDEMRSELIRAFPQVRALAGTAEAIPLPDGSVDVVVCAQAFHWFATAEALAEMHRVLKRSGRLGLIWNGRDESVPWVAALSDITNRYEGETPRYRTGAWRQAFPAPGFRQIDEQHIRNAHVGSAEDVVLKRTLSVSFIAALPDEQRREVERDVRALIARTFPLAAGGDVVFPYETSMYAYASVELP